MALDMLSPLFPPVWEIMVFKKGGQLELKCQEGITLDWLSHKPLLDISHTAIITTKKLIIIALTFLSNPGELQVYVRVQMFSESANARMVYACSDDNINSSPALCTDPRSVKGNQYSSLLSSNKQLLYYSDKKKKKGHKEVLSTLYLLENTHQERHNRNVSTPIDMQMSLLSLSLSLYFSHGLWTMTRTCPLIHTGTHTFSVLEGLYAKLGINLSLKSRRWFLFFVVIICLHFCLLCTEPGVSTPYPLVFVSLLSS